MSARYSTSSVARGLISAAGEYIVYVDTKTQAACCSAGLLGKLLMNIKAGAEISKLQHWGSSWAPVCAGAFGVHAACGHCARRKG